MKLKVSFKFEKEYILSLMHIDYVPLGTTSVTLDPLQNITCFSGEIINDVIALEETEEFWLLLQDPMMNGVILATDSAVVIILDDDGK